MSVTTSSASATWTGGRSSRVLLAGLDLTKAFGPTTALDHASLAIYPGEIVAVMGSSGSGKSTLLHCLAGIIAPDSGTVHYDGTEIGAMTDTQRSALRRKDFGFVFQFGQLVPELTCLENVTLPLRLAGLARRPAEAAAGQWLDRLEVTDVAAKRPGDVSGGQGQRVAVARALVTGP
ncbi:MAG TPA: ATP-binding cassette domain-containing protein, partial [Pseudonocardiaceae bacterium]|nr:ATP-binding cassette domain-containing protein [Pseudonocardiaceae bacterium]